MTGAELVEDVCGPLSYEKTDTTLQNRVLRWLNESAIQIAGKYDWPEYITHDASLALTGAVSYDLTAVGNAGATFLRVIGDTVRIGTRNLELKTKAWRDSSDPARTRTGSAYYFGIEGRTYFWVFPNESSGTLYYDWMKYPPTIAYATTEANIPFDKEKHSLIMRGALWRGKQYFGDTDWLVEKRVWKDDVKEQFVGSSSARVTGNVTIITNIDF